MGRQLFCVLIAALLFVPRLRADTTVSDGSATNFEAALATTIAAGGGTILVTTPILIGATNDTTDDTFDGESKVVISGGNTNSIFIVQGGTLTLANFTLANGASTNGGAIYITQEGALSATNCVFSNNNVHGIDGVSADTNAPVGGPVTGRNGSKGTSALSALGGAIFNLGDASILACQFLTNSATGGDGGHGGAGSDAGSRGGNGGSGGSGGGALGGGIYNRGTLTMANSTFSGNLAQGGSGGAGGAGGSGIISGVAGNGGTGGTAVGAGLYTLYTNAAVVIIDCTFSANIAQGGAGADGGTSSGGIGQTGRTGGNALGGGIDNAGLIAVTNSTFFENNAIGGTGGNGGGGGRGGNGGTGGNAVGGGIYNTGIVAVVNCTFSKGAAIGGTNGGAGSGVAGGRNGKKGSSSGGNIANVQKKRKASFVLGDSTEVKCSFLLMNSIVATGLSGGGASGTITDGHYNISADKSIKFKKKATSKSNTNPLVGDLSDNGGPTETIALTTNSPALDLIPTNQAPPFDQRGVKRPQMVFTNLSDIGAFELDKDTATILTHPQSTNVIQGSNVTFTVSAGGTGPLFFQWFFDDAPVIDATNTFLTITNVQPTNAGNFQVIVTNAFNSATSHVAVLGVITITNSPPTIAKEPVDIQTNVVGSTVSISVTAVGSAPLAIQWSLQNSNFLFVNIAGATNSTFSIANVQTTNSGNYRVTITNSFGTTNSTPSTLIITNVPGGGITPPFEGSLPKEAQPSLVPLAVGSDGGTLGSMNFKFATQIGATYVIEYKKSLTDPVWTPISTNIGNGDWLTNQVPITDQPSGFYRVRSP